MTPKNFEKYGLEFQLKVLFYLIYDKTFAVKVVDIIDDKFFTNEYYQDFMGIIRNHINKYHIVPTFDVLKSTISTSDDTLDEVAKDYMLKMLSVLASNEDFSDKDYIEDETIEFCKKQAMFRAIENSIPLLDGERYDHIVELVQKALMAGMVSDLGQNYFDTVENRTIGLRYPIPTGFDLIDKIMSGGLGRKEMGLIMAGTGVGKSMLLTHLGAAALKAGYKVLYYTFELSEDMVGFRFDTCLTNIHLSQLMTDTEGQWRADVAQTVKKIKAKTGADLIIKEYPTKTATITTLKSHIEAIKANGFVPDLILVDYADLMKSLSGYNDKRFELESIIENLRALASSENCALWSASQTNRAGLETSIVSLNTISEGLGKAMVVDFILAIGRDLALIEKGEACYYVAKSRIGPDKLIYTGKFDTGNLDFRIDRQGLKSTINAEYDAAVNDKVSDVISKLFPTKPGEGI